MPAAFSWLCQYAIAQIGRPYWFATTGQISSMELYTSTVQPALQSSGYSPYNDVNSQLNLKVHDCSGLILGALTCDSFNDPPNHSYPLEHSATSQYNRCVYKGRMTSFVTKIPGTLVFKSSDKKATTKTHVGIYVGKLTDLNGNHFDNAVVEAMGHKYGVVVNELKNGSWDCWGQLDLLRDTYIDTEFDARQLVTPQSENLSTSGGVQLNIDPTALKPFVATVLAGQNPTIDYDKIRKARVSAMMFFGGQYFTSNHTPQTYMNGYLANQIQRCNDAGMPYALYVNVRARTVIEADAECRALYYVISRYPPKLGLWLALQTNATIKSVNDSILEVYYKYLYRWGLGAKCGLYITRAQINTITWDSFKDRFYLWCIDDMNVSEIDDELLTPEMFEVAD